MELFHELSSFKKMRIKFWVNAFLLEDDLKVAIRRLWEFRNSLKTENEKEFVDFYFNLKTLEKSDEENYFN